MYYLLSAFFYFLLQIPVECVQFAVDSQKPVREYDLVNMSVAKPMLGSSSIMLVYPLGNRDCSSRCNY